MAVAPISWARSTALTMPWPSGRWAPRRRPSGSIGECYDASPMGPMRQKSASVLGARLGPFRVFAGDDRLDDPVVAVVASIEDGHPLVLGVHEDEELMTEILHLGHCVFLEHRFDRETLDLHDALLAAGGRRPVGKPSEDLLLLLGPRPQTRLLLVVDGLALDLVDDLVDGGLVARALCVAVHGLAIDDESHIGHVRVGGAAMLLVGELDDDVRAVVQQTVQTSQP